MAAAHPFLRSKASAPLASAWAAKSHSNKREGQRCCRGQLHPPVINFPKGSTFRAALGTPCVFCLRRCCSGSASCVARLNEKVASISNRTVNVSLNANGRTRLIDERHRLVKARVNEPETSGETTKLSSEDHRLELNPGQADAIIEGQTDGSKRCTECRHFKLLEDFEGTTTSADGRHDVCRACMAACRAKRSGKKLSHLGLSVAEAWERAKKCDKCGRIKEARDFYLKRDVKSLLGSECRACTSARLAAVPDNEPQNKPQKCGKCGMVKPATEFYVNRKTATGLGAKCKQCVGEVIKKTHARKQGLGDGAFVQRSKKRCSKCGEEKKVEHFYRNKVPTDGLSNRCKACTCAYLVRRRARKQAVPKSGAPDGARVSGKKEGA